MQAALEVVDCRAVASLAAAAFLVAVDQAAAEEDSQVAGPVVANQVVVDLAAVAVSQAVGVVRAALAAVVPKVVAAKVVAAKAEHAGAALDSQVVAHEEAPVDAKSIPAFPAQQRSGVTLLELVLALGLSTIVMGLIAMAINLNYKMFDVKRTNVEEAQLARSLLRHIADDIRAAVQHMPPDLSGLETVAGNSQNASSMLGGSGAMGALGGLTGGQTGGQTGGGTGTGQQNTAQTGGAGAGGTGGGGANTGGGTGSTTPKTGSTNMTTTGGVNPQTEQATSTYGEEQAGGIIGVFGSSTELQLDISRLPRIDQYQAEMDPNSLLGVVDIPSDMKTVSYYLRPEEGMVSVSLEGRGRGLMRRVLDRAVSTYAEENGNTLGALGETELLAEEVVGLEFMYFDGASWASEWDSSEMQGLPVAIEITLVMQSQGDQSTRSSSLNPLAGMASGTEEEAEEKIYTLTVNLPTASPFEEKPAPGSEEDTALSQTGALDTSGNAAAAGLAGGLPGGAGGLPGLGGLGGQGAGGLGGGQPGGGPRGGGGQPGGGQQGGGQQGGGTRGGGGNTGGSPRGGGGQGGGNPGGGNQGGGTRGGSSGGGGRGR